MNKKLELISLLFSILLLIGCGGETVAPRYKVVGKVTLNNEPLGGADVRFKLKGTGDVATAKTNDAGEYELLAAAGVNRITVSKSKEVKMEDDDSGGASGADIAVDNLSPEEKATMGEGGSGDAGTMTTVLLTPAKYATAGESGLKFTVEANEDNKFDITMEGELLE